MLNPRCPVFLLDVDDTLLDNDRFGADLGARLERLFGTAARERYWSIYAARREELGYADYLGALQVFRHGLEDDRALLTLSSFLLDYPFADRVYPGALETIASLAPRGLAVILSDGDIVFQPRKIQRAGLWDAVGGRVLVTLHKDQAIDLVQREWPAAHYVAVDDKPQLLARMKRAMGARLTTVFVRQGHYAAEAAGTRIDPAPDHCIDRIAALRDLALGCETASSEVT
jgi:FMN phosphatase YigB (HAD superfamily)